TGDDAPRRFCTLSSTACAADRSAGWVRMATFGIPCNVSPPYDATSESPSTVVASPGSCRPLVFSICFSGSVGGGGDEQVPELLPLWRCARRARASLRSSCLRFGTFGGMALAGGIAATLPLHEIVADPK